MKTHTVGRGVRLFIPALFVPGAALAQESPGIADLAPARSFLVAGVRNWTEFRASLDASEMGRLWAEPSVQAFVDRVIETEFEGSGEWFDEAGIRPEEITAPTGAVGLALFSVDPPEDAEDGASPPRGILISADFGENADGWSDLLARLIERHEADEMIEVREEDYNGVTLTRVRILEDEAEEPAPEEEEDEFEFEEEPTGPAQTLRELTGGDDLVIARVGTTFLLGTDDASVEAAVDALGGAGAEAVSSAPAFRESLAQHPEDPVAYAVFLAEPLIDELAGLLEDAPMLPMGTDPRALLEAAGILDARAASIALRFGTPHADAEQTVAVLMPRKRGLAALFDVPVGPFAPPAFVGPDASSVTRFGFRFDAVMATAREVVATLPPDEGAPAEEAINQATGMVGPALEVMGPGIYMVTTLARPLAGDSEKMVIAIESRDPLIMSNTITMLNSMIGGPMSPRDFEGNTIFSSPDNTQAVGLGFGHVFIGNGTAVENAMRMAGNPEGPRLATEDGFAAAASILAPDAAVYTYTGIRDYIQWAYWGIEHAQEITAAQFEGLDLDPELKAELLANIEAEQPQWTKEMPPQDVLLDHLGDVVSEFRSTPDGFRGRTLWLRPRP